MTEHANVYAALAAAQPEMATIVKGSVNPHFKSKYADLAEVITAVRPALNKHGLSLFRTIVHVPELGTCHRTVLAHGKSGTFIECDVPIIVSGNANAQQFKAACTYAARIGAESVTGTAPDEDDDGNTAASAAPKNGSASLEKPKRASSAEMKRWLVKLDEDLIDVHTLVALEKLRTSVEHGMAVNNWPNLDPDGEDYETGFPKMARDKMDACEARIIAAMDAAEVKDLREPNLIGAG